MTTYHIFKCITIISGAYRVVSSQVVSIGNICMCYWQKKNYLVSFPDAYMCLIAKQFFLSVEVRVAVRDNENTWDYRLEANDLVGSVPMWSESGSELCLDHPFSLLGALLKYQVCRCGNLSETISHRPQQNELLTLIGYPYILQVFGGQNEVCFSWNCYNS